MLRKGGNMAAKVITAQQTSETVVLTLKKVLGAVGEWEIGLGPVQWGRENSR